MWQFRQTVGGCLQAIIGSGFNNVALRKNVAGCPQAIVWKKAAP
jgi:hypothetical protein